MEIYHFDINISSKQYFKKHIDYVIEKGLEKKYSKACIDKSIWLEKSDSNYYTLKDESLLFYHSKHEGLEYYLFDNESKNKPINKKLVYVLVMTDSDIEKSLNFVIEDIKETFNININKLLDNNLYIYPVDRESKDIIDPELTIKTQITLHEKSKKSNIQLYVGITIFLLSIIPASFNVWPVFLDNIGLKVDRILVLSIGFALIPLIEKTVNLFKKEIAEYHIKIVSAEDIMPIEEKPKIEKVVDADDLFTPSLGN